VDWDVFYKLLHVYQPPDIADIMWYWYELEDAVAQAERENRSQLDIKSKMKWMWNMSRTSLDWPSVLTDYTHTQVSTHPR
jgi:hypothetical protein